MDDGVSPTPYPTCRWVPIYAPGHSRCVRSSGVQSAGTQYVYRIPQRKCGRLTSVEGFAGAGVVQHQMCYTHQLIHVVPLPPASLSYTPPHPPRYGGCGRQAPVAQRPELCSTLRVFHWLFSERSALCGRMIGCDGAWGWRIGGRVGDSRLFLRFQACDVPYGELCAVRSYKADLGVQRAVVPGLCMLRLNSARVHAML